MLKQNIEQLIREHFTTNTELRFQATVYSVVQRDDSDCDLWIAEPDFTFLAESGASLNIVLERIMLNIENKILQTFARGRNSGTVQ